MQLHPDTHTPEQAAQAIVEYLADHPWAYVDSPEPYRTVAWTLGLESFDGTPYWHAVMDAIG